MTGIRKLKGRVEADDACIGGERRNGKRGRGSEDKIPFIAAVETTDAGCEHEAIVVGSDRKSIDIASFSWVNTILGNLQNAITGAYHSTGARHMPRYLAEFQYRFNRRFDLKGMLKRLLYASVRTAPMPVRLLAVAENAWYQVNDMSCRATMMVS